MRLSWKHASAAPYVPKTRSRFSPSWQQHQRRSPRHLPLPPWQRVRRLPSRAFISQAASSSVRVLPSRSSVPARLHPSSASLTVRAVTFCTIFPPARWKPVAVR